MRWLAVIPDTLPTRRIVLHGPTITEAARALAWSPLVFAPTHGALWCNASAEASLRAGRNHYGQWCAVELREGAVQCELYGDAALMNEECAAVERGVRALVDAGAVLRWEAWAQYDDTGECSAVVRGDADALRG